MIDKHTIVRTPQVVKDQIAILNSLGWKFEVQHGTYTTKIKSPMGTLTLSTIQFPNRVFVAANMVKKDCLNSDKGKEILSATHSKINYANNVEIDRYSHPIVYNIDIKGAYATCLYNSQLITDNTHNYIQKLPKVERLPCVGMLAKSHIKYFYQDGECVGTQSYRAPTSQLFFFLIQEIDEVMREVKWILGNYFLYYWVDGVFFKWETPQWRIDDVMAFLRSRNYNFTFEEVFDFKYVNNDGQCVISLIKDKELKEWNFRSNNEDNDLLKRMLYSQSLKKSKLKKQ